MRRDDRRERSRDRDRHGRGDRENDDRRRDRPGRDDRPPRRNREEMGAPPSPPPMSPRGPPPERRGRRRDREGSIERRSPTPEGAMPLSQRKRKASGWDVHAPGYEQYSAMQAKQTGMSFRFYQNKSIC